MAYVLTATVGLYQFGAGLTLISLILLGVPAVLLARFSAAPSPVLATVAAFAVGMTLLLEGVAYSTGLWQFASNTGLVWFGWLSLELVLLAVLKVIFLVLFYELIFDDGVYHTRVIRGHMAEFVCFALAALVLVLVGQWWFAPTSAPETYYWIVALLLLASIAMLAVRSALTVHLFDKLVHFAAIGFVPLLCLEFLLVANGIKTVSGDWEVVTIPFTAIGLPLGEWLLALSIPVFVTVVYELYLDDRV